VLCKAGDLGQVHVLLVLVGGTAVVVQDSSGDRNREQERRSED
jgi:hypothetical protein